MPAKAATKTKIKPDVAARIRVLEARIGELKTRPIKTVSFKHEDEDRGMAIGPVWVEFQDGDCVNFEDGEPSFEKGKFHPKWFDKRQAYKLAELLGVELEEV